MFGNCQSQSGCPADYWKQKARKSDLPIPPVSPVPYQIWRFLPVDDWQPHNWGVIRMDKVPPLFVIILTALLIKFVKTCSSRTIVTGNIRDIFGIINHRLNIQTPHTGSPAVNHNIDQIRNAHRFDLGF